MPLILKIDIFGPQISHTFLRNLHIYFLKLVRAWKFTETYRVLFIVHMYIIWSMSEPVTNKGLLEGHGVAWSLMESQWSRKCIELHRFENAWSRKKIRGVAKFLNGVGKWKAPRSKSCIKYREKWMFQHKNVRSIVKCNKHLFTLSKVHHSKVDPKSLTRRVVYAWASIQVHGIMFVDGNHPQATSAAWLRIAYIVMVTLKARSKIYTLRTRKQCVQFSSFCMLVMYDIGICVHLWIMRW